MISELLETALGVCGRSQKVDTFIASSWEKWKLSSQLRRIGKVLTWSGIHIALGG
jgi:hypothetical protein